MKHLALVALITLAGAASAAPTIDDIDPPVTQAALDSSSCGAQWCRPFWKSMPKLEYVFYAAEAADMLTTLDIKNHPNLQEENPLLGHHPSDATIVGATTITALIHSSITYLMVDHDVNPKVIRAWEILSIGTESGFALHNWKMGLRFKF